MDHPRGCGEHHSPGSMAEDVTGSSPRMRGAPVDSLESSPRRGIIPADAGSTAKRPFSSGLSRDHPRGCGEHCPDVLIASWETGSSPRMRGAPGQPCLCEHSAGIIPADAGSTAFQNIVTNFTKDHPRGCGEHGSGHTDAGQDGGSSPRMRGAHPQDIPPLRGSGIIPADAGSTLILIHTILLRQDHPRGCGEHCTTGLQCDQRQPADRIIPADAGSTGTGHSQWSITEDHPRGCGEHFGLDEFGRLPGGSSPRMRGAPLANRVDVWENGIIPADAGSTP